MPIASDGPFTIEELAALDEDCVDSDERPWGHVTDAAFAFTTDAEPDVVRTDLGDRVYALRAPSVLLDGLPVIDAGRGETLARTVSERFEARRSWLDGRRFQEQPRAIQGEPFRPAGVAQAQLPRVAPTPSERLVGWSARGNRVLLSATPHVTITGGESRHLIYPDRFPYMAICKIEISHRPAGAPDYILKGHATGFLVGRRTMMTSGHVAEDLDGTVRMRVIPACWANQPVFGRGLITYVRSSWSWHSDSGNDLQVCELYDPIGERLGFFGFRHYRSSWQDRSVFAMAGFHHDLSLYALSGETGIAVRDDDDGDDINVDGASYDTTQIESDADEASGASGAPLFGWWAEGPYAIGVHSGTEHDWTTSGLESLACAAGGDGFVAVASWGRSMWG